MTLRDERTTPEESQESEEECDTLITVSSLCLGSLVACVTGSLRSSMPGGQLLDLIIYILKFRICQPRRPKGRMLVSVRVVVKVPRCRAYPLRALEGRFIIAVIN